MLEEFKKKKFYLVLYYDDLVSFYLDYKILKFLNIEDFFIYKLKCQLMIEVAKCPKHYIILSDNCSLINQFQNIGTWTGLLVTLVLSKLDLSGEYYDQVNKNIKNIKEGFKPDFTATTFFQQKYIYQVILSLINETKEIHSNSILLEEKLTNKVKCLTAVKTGRSTKEYKKHMFFLSNEKCIFYPHLGGHDISLNKKFDVLLNRTFHTADFIKYKPLLNNLVDYTSKNREVLWIDNFNNIDGFILRDKMVELLTRFISLNSIKILNAKYNAKLEFPTSQFISLKILLNFNECMSYLKRHNINLPIILKFQSDEKEVSHQMLLIISENGLKNVSQFAKKFNAEKTFCVIQKYANHGGEVFKLYHYNAKSKIFLRPSIPDMMPQYEKIYDELSQGYLSFKTSDLSSKRVVEMFKKFDRPVNVKNLINEKYLDEVSNLFETFVEKTLFGLDFLYDYRNKIYLIIDCNNFPGYKEIEKTFSNDLSEHVNFYYEKHLKTLY